MTSLSERNSCCLGRHVFPLLLPIVTIMFLDVSPLVLLSQAVGIAELFSSFSLFHRLLVSTTFLAPVGRSDFVPVVVVEAALDLAPVRMLALGSVLLAALVLPHFVGFVPTVGYR